MVRLPTPGHDGGSWGDLLNDFLLVEHNIDGSLRPGGSLAGKYTKPAGGIPKNHLSSGVQAALDNAEQAATSIVGLSDTQLTSTADSQVLTFDGLSQKWKNKALPQATDADASVKGVLKLAGDLGGSASNPQVKSRAVKATVYPDSGDYPVSAYASASAAIQAALNAVGASGGGEVYVGEGAYTLPFTLGLPSNVVLRGSNSKKTVFTLANSVNGHIITNADTTNGNTGIGISNLVLEGNSANQTTGRGIFFKRVTDSRIEHVIIQNTKTDGIALDNCLNVYGDKLQITHAVGTGFLFITSSYCGVKNSEISYNHVGVALASTSNHNYVSDNRILHTELYSLLGGTAADTGFNSYNRFSHNIIEYGGDDALVLDHNPYTTCIGNQVRYCGGHAGDQGLPIDTSANSVVSGNIVEYNRADGIELKNSSNYCTITGNICRNNSNPAVGGLRDGAGIVVRAGIIGCTITGNTAYCDEALPSQRRGIILTGVGVNYNTVTGNVVYGNSINQIELSSNVGTNNTISNNSGSNATNTNVLISKIPDQPTKFINATTSNTIEVVPTGNTGSSRNKGALFVDNSSNPGVGFGMYSTYGAGGVAPLMSLRNGDTIENTTWDYNPAIALWTNVSNQTALIVDQANTLTASRAGVLVKSSVEQTNPNALGMIAGQQLNSLSNNSVYWGDQSGTGDVYTGRSSGGGIVFMADQNSNNLGADIDRDTTNTNSTTNTVRIVDTANVSDGNTYTKSGTALSVTSNIASPAGTVTDASRLATFTQANGANTADAFTITNAGSGATFVLDTNLFVAKGDKVGIGTSAPTARLDTPASTAAAAGLRVRQGVAPSAPNSGDIWQDGAHIYARLGGNTFQLDQQNSSGFSSVTKIISQTSHGLSVGNLIRYNGTGFVKAQANNAANADCFAIVSSVTDANTFVITTSGFVSGLSGLTAGALYYLSPTTAGGLTSSEPTTAGQISKPVFVADSATSGYVVNYRGTAVASTVTAPNTWSPSDQSLISWSFDPTIASSTSILPSAGVMHLARLPINSPTTVTNILLDVTTAGAGLTSAGAAIYQNGILLGQTADQSANWTTTNSKTMALSGGAISVATGYVYVAVWANGTTLPTLARGVGRSNINIGTSSSNYRFASSGSGITTTPPTNLGTLAASSLSWWFGIS